MRWLPAVHSCGAGDGAGRDGDPSRQQEDRSVPPEALRLQQRAHRGLEVPIDVRRHADITASHLVTATIRASPGRPLHPPDRASTSCRNSSTCCAASSPSSAPARTHASQSGPANSMRCGPRLLRATPGQARRYRLGPDQRLARRDPCQDAAREARRYLVNPALLLHRFGFRAVDFYDFRPAPLSLPDLFAGAADLTALLPFADNSIHSLSCMHVLEHIGLGRYGDPLDPDGDLKAIGELVLRVVARRFDLLVATGRSARSAGAVQRPPRLRFRRLLPVGHLRPRSCWEFALIREDGAGTVCWSNPAPGPSRDQVYSPTAAAASGSARRNCETTAGLACVLRWRSARAFDCIANQVIVCHIAGNSRKGVP